MAKEKPVFAIKRIKIGSKRFGPGERVTGLDRAEFKELSRLNLIEFKKEDLKPKVEDDGGVTEAGGEKAPVSEQEDKGDPGKQDVEKNDAGGSDKPGSGKK